LRGVSKDGPGAPVSVILRGSQALAPQDDGPRAKKKPGSKEPGLRYWPREADTITFQEGLLNARATGGGGQMRNANAQRVNIIVLGSAMQQPPREHVSHALSGTANQDGQRCALLTTKSRNTCTRATVFSSSG